MKVVITINIENDAFQNNNEYFEVHRILFHLANKIKNDYDYPSTLHDINGNTVGKVEIIEDDVWTR